MTSMLCSLECVAIFASLRVDIGALVEQQPHDVGVTSKRPRHCLHGYEGQVSPIIDTDTRADPEGQDYYVHGTWKVRKRVHQALG